MATNKSGRMVTLSAAPQLILERLGIQLSKIEILQAGKDGGNEMVFVSNNKTYVNVDAFVDSFFENLSVPVIQKEDLRKDAAGRYRTVNVAIMQTLLRYLFSIPDGGEGAETLKNMMVEELGRFTRTDVKKDGTNFGADDLERHLKSFVYKPKKVST